MASAVLTREATLEEVDALRARLELRLRLRAQQQAQVAVVDPYQADPVGWMEEKLGAFVWSKQRAIAESVRDHRRTAVHSAHETGKSYLAARIVAWWLDTHPVGEAFAVTTATTGAQVRAVLWREIRRAHAAGGLRGRLNQTEWWLNDELVAFGRKPADYDPTAFQGIHARYVLVVIDEACGVPEEIFRAAGSLAANEHSRVLAIGNPDNPQSYFGTICQPGSGWHVIHVDGLASPNFTDEPIPDSLRDLLLSPVYAQELADELGEDSPIYISKVRGQFPEDASDGVIPLSFIRQCQVEREWTPDDLLPIELGFDVGAGGDESVIRERRGVQVGRVWRFRERDPMVLAGHVVAIIQETGASAIKIDVIGIGWGLAGRLAEIQAEGVHTAQVVPVNVGMASLNPARFPKLRDQVWWECGRELLQQRVIDLTGLDDTTVAQLCAPRWQPDSANRIKIEPKAETRKRLKRSPDDADALLLAYLHLPDGPPQGVVTYEEHVTISEQ